MTELAIKGLKHTIRSKKPQDATQCFSMGADGSSEFGTGAGRFVQLVGNAEVGDDVKARREAVTARDLPQSRKWIEFSHESPLNAEAVMFG